MYCCAVSVSVYTQLQIIILEVSLSYINMFGSFIFPSPLKFPIIPCLLQGAGVNSSHPPPSPRSCFLSMEQNPENDVITIPNSTANDPSYEYDDLQSPKKKNGPVNVLRVALLRMRGRSRKSRVLSVDDGSKSIWRKMVGSMRPLHLQGSQSLRSFSETDIQPPSPSLTPASDFLAEDDQPYSPSPPSTRYASAVGLNELVQSDEENEKQGEIVEEECKEHDNGDEMIDAKADDFIAQFYQEMRLQRLSFTDRAYKERSERSLGW